MIHESKYDEVLSKLKAAYSSIRARIGDPLESGTLYGPLHSKVGVEGYLKTLEDAKAAGGVIEYGGSTIDRAGNYVEPTIVTGLPHNAEVVHRYLPLTNNYLLILTFSNQRDIRPDSLSDEVQECGGRDSN